MKYIIVLTICVFSLASCNEIKQKSQLSRMCNCMEKHQQDFNNKAAQELLGSPYMTTLAGAAALGCAQELMEKDNLSYTEMTALYQQFLNSECGIKYGIDNASINKAQKEAKETLNRIMNKKEEKSPINNVDLKPEIDPMPTEQSYSDTPSIREPYFSDSLPK